MSPMNGQPQQQARVSPRASLSALTAREREEVTQAGLNPEDFVVLEVHASDLKVQVDPNTGMALVVLQMLFPITKLTKLRPSRLMIAGKAQQTQQSDELGLGAFYPRWRAPVLRSMVDDETLAGWSDLIDAENASVAAQITVLRGLLEDLVEKQKAREAGEVSED